MKKEEFSGLEIAVIGIALKFPGANNPEEFWENLKNGKESIKFFTDQELDELKVDPAVRNDTRYVRTGGGLIEKKEYFDASFFGYTPEEAILMHPQTRLFHEISWKAIEDSGYDVTSYDGRIGLFAGSSNSFYWEALTELAGSSREIGQFAATQLTSKDFLTSKISYKLNLKGPSVPVQTACSTSLVAVHLAARALLLGECDMALAGGATVNTYKEQGYLYQEGMILSKDGHCRSFDSCASGTNSGNGAGVVVLKLLKKALADNDHIYAVIKGSAVNNDGNRKAGYTAPSVKGQTEVIRSALSFSKVEAGTVQYVECHGTGTALGDPIELEALSQAFYAAPPHSCGISCVKSNIGHLDSAAGIAGFIKAVLSLRHRCLVPSINYSEPNPKLNLENTPFYVVTGLTEWKSLQTPRRAGVSSFGIGGTNAHIVLEEAPERRQTVPGSKYSLLVTSAKSENSLNKNTASLVDFLNRNPGVNPSDAAYTLLTGRAVFPYKRYIVVEHGASQTLPASVEDTRFKTLCSSLPAPAAIFLFPGGGAQYVNMAKGLFDEMPFFKSVVDQGVSYLSKATGRVYMEYLYPCENVADRRVEWEDPEIALPLLFVIEFALAKQLMQWGLEPKAMIGHSLGEYVAACLAGVFSFEDGLKIVLKRGQLMKQVEEDGAMLSVAASSERIGQMIDNEACIAAINSPSNAVIAGPKSIIAKIRARFEDSDIEAKTIHIAVASHSRMMEPLLGEFETLLSQIEFKKPSIPYISNVTGGWIEQELLDARYWSAHLRRTVQFSDGVRSILTKWKKCLFVEVGPGNILSTIVRQHGLDIAAINLIRHPNEAVPDDYYLLNKLGELWLQGGKLNWNQFFAGNTISGNRIAVPTYEFDQQRYWIDKELQELASAENDNLQRNNNRAEWFYYPSWSEAQTVIPASSGTDQHNYLLFKENSPFSHHLENELKNRSINLFTVSFDRRSNSNNGTDYTLEGKKYTDFSKLLAHLNAGSIKPAKIIYLTNLTVSANPPDADRVNDGLKDGFYALTSLARALAAQEDSEPAEIVMVTNQLHHILGGEVMNLPYSTILGPVKTITQEHPWLLCKNVDINILPDSSLDQRLVSQLCDELLSSSTEHIVALRNNKRWTISYKELSFNSTVKRPAVFKEKGTYLLTGGLGRIGFTIMEYLSRVYQANLVITGRTPIPDRANWDSWIKVHGREDPVSKKIGKIKLLEANGSQVIYVAADICQLESMEIVIGQAISEFTRIDGVIHSTAMTGSENFQTVSELDPGTCENHFHSKIHGLISLHRLLSEIDYDFCLLMSSVSSVLGGLGFSAYAAANGFMDHFADYISVVSKKRWISIGWDGWEYWEDKANGIVFNDGIFRMTPDESTAAMEDILNSGQNGCLIHSLSSLNKRLKVWVSRNWYDHPKQTGEVEKSSSLLYRKPQVLTPYKEPANPTQQYLLDIWTDFFKYDKIGVYDNFFELGGNSLKGISLIGLIHRKLKIQIPIKEFFTRGNIADLAEYIDNSALTRYRSIPKAELKEYYPLSSAQLRLFLVQQISKETLAYNETYTFKIKGELDLARFNNALQVLVNEHSIFRTQIVLLNDEPVQKILKQVPVQLACFDVSEEDLKKLIGEFVKPFNLETPPYLRAGLFSSGRQNHVLVLDIHHLIIDGISAGNFLMELSDRYHGKEKNREHLQYKDYAEWQFRNKATEEFKRKKASRLKAFSGELPELNLPLDFVRPKVRSFEGEIMHFEIPKGTIAALQHIAESKSVSSYIAWLTAYKILLSKLTNQNDIIIGTPTSGRFSEELESTMGMFVNTVVLRSYIDHDLSFHELLREVNDQTLQAFDQQDYQYEQLVEDINLVRDPGINPLFDAVFTYQNMALGQQASSEIEFLPFDYSNAATKFDLILAITEAGKSRQFSFNYSTALFTRDTIMRFVGYFNSILDFLIKHPSEPLSHADILTGEVKKDLLELLGDHQTTYPVEETVLGKFEEQVRRFPDKTAVVCGRTVLTYKELDTRATKISVALATMGVRSQSVVAVYLEQSIDVVCGILGVMKTGCGYLPVDVNYPQDRVRYILEDSACALLLSNGTAAAGINLPCPVLNIDDPSIYRLAVSSYTKPAVSPDHLLYIIYTSGTTGNPKGVMVEHRNVVRLLFNTAFQFDFSENDVWTLFHSHAFDFSVWEMYGALLYGGKLVIVPKLIAKDTAAFAQLLIEEQVTVLNQTPMAFYNVANELLHRDHRVALRYIIFGGEALTPGKLARWYEQYPDVDLINMYGITETTVHVTFKKLLRSDIELNISNIGRPIPTLSVYIMDSNLKLQLPGIPGELCVGGAGVTRGYLNRPELTASKFIDNPFEPSGKIYRSGDLVRLLSNGEMAYLGRIDAQVKIRGYRIELGEIEHQVISRGDITEAVAVVIENIEGEKSIGVYFVAGAKVDVNDMRSYLEGRLADYMRPAYLIQVEMIPLTNHGKIDKKAFPKPSLGDQIASVVAPTNLIEKQLAEIWQATLELDLVSIKSSFFHLGGDSIKAIRLVNRINNHFHSKIKLADLYLNETVEKLAYFIDSRTVDHTEEEKKNALSAIEQLRVRALKSISDQDNIEDIYPMTQIESGMLFNYLKNVGLGVYHDQFVYHLTFEGFDRELFTSALMLLVDKHEILRSGFNIRDFDEFVHIVYKNIELPIQYLDFSAIPKQEHENRIRAILSTDLEDPFSEEGYPLWRMKLVKRSPSTFTLMLIFHHAILDGWSVASFMTELNNTYYALFDNPKFVPVKLRSSYKAAVIEEYVEKVRQNKLAFWIKELADYQRSELPFISNFEKQGCMNIYKRKLDTSLLSALKQVADSYNTSLKNLLFAAYVFVVQIFSGGDEVVVGWVTNNRPLVEDGDKILGCFLNTIPVRLRIPYGITYGEYIVLINKKMLALKEYESVPLFEIAKAIGEKNTGRNPIFDTLFNFVNFHIYNDVVTKDTTGVTPGNEIEDDGNQNTNTLFDFEVSITNDKLYLLPKYDPTLIRSDFILKFCDYYLNILNNFIFAGEAKAGANNIIPKSERKKLLRHFNDTRAEYNRSVTLHEVFEKKALECPGAVAINHNDASVTFDQLNRRANQLAFLLRKNGTGPGVLVGVVTERSFEMIVAMIAILKAGGAYVPMEPNLPDARVALIIKSQGICTILTDTQTFPKIQEIAAGVKTIAQVYLLDAGDSPEMTSGCTARVIGSASWESLPDQDLDHVSCADDIAYVMFTSGSTGTPKGVVVKHRPVINVIEWVNRSFQVSGQDKLLFINSIGFDLSVYDVFGMLAAGGTMHLLAYHDFANPRNLLNIIIKEKITIWNSAPAAIQLITPLLDQVQPDVNTNLRLILLSGDWIPVTLPDFLRKTFKKAKVVSLGGATEATIWSNYYNIEEVNTNWKSIPYGRPIQNSKYLILNNHLELCPIDVPGDLYIGGECLSSGYIDDLELTAQKFIKSPFNPGEIIYKTGDMARWNSDGDMEFLGRKDGQVKIRGFRIEAGEIESHLLKHEDIQHAIVLPHVNNRQETCLCAYIVPKENAHLTSSALTEYLALWISHYMIPDFFIFLDKIPVTINGKLNKKLLPPPELSTLEEYIAPANEIETGLAEIWVNILGLEGPVSSTSNFFEIGGHSLNVALLISQIHKAFGIEMSIREVFTYSTIRMQAERIGIITPPSLLSFDSAEREKIII